LRPHPSPSGRGAGGEGDWIVVQIKGVDVCDPTTGQIAVTVINHYGDELLKVLAV